MLNRQPHVEELSPVNDLIIVKLIDNPDIKIGQLALASGNDSNEVYAEVVAVGPGSYQNGVLIPPRVKAGDTVMMWRNRGTFIRLYGENFLFVQERDFMAVLKNNE